VFGAGMPGSWPEERRRAEGVLDPLAEIIEVTPGGQAEPHAPPRAGACAGRMRYWSLGRRDITWVGCPLGT
jgi:hypothetical protein